MRRLNRQAFVQILRAMLAPLAGVLVGALLVLWTRPAPKPITAPVIQVFVPSVQPTRVLPTEFIPIPEPTPVPIVPTFTILPSDTLALEVVNLRQDLQHALGSIRVLNAAGRIQQARIALRDNDLAEVQRQLTIAQEQLDSATLVVSDEIKANLQNINNDINYLRDDISVRPETIESRLMAIWEQLMVVAAVE